MKGFQALIKGMSERQRQVGMLYVSTMVGTLLGFLSSIVNTRFMSTTDYGDVKYVQNIINFLSVVLLFGVFVSGSRLLALSDDEQHRRRIRGCLMVFLFAASAILMLATGANYFFCLDKPQLAWLFVASLPVCMQPLLLNFINTVLQGDNHIGRIALARLLPYLLYVPVAFVVYSSWGANSTLMILLQWGIGTVVLLALIFSTNPRFDNLKPVFSELRRENHSYGIQLYYGSLIMVATNYVAGITLGVFNVDNSVVGFYTLALTITSPLMLLPSIVGTTYFKQFATQTHIPTKVLKATLLITLFSFIAFVALIKPLVTFLYAECYAVVGTYACWLALGYCVHGVGDMLNRYLGSHGQGTMIRNASFFCGVIKIVGFTLFVYLYGITGAIVTCVLSSLTYCLSLTFYYYRFVREAERCVNEQI